MKDASYLAVMARRNEVMKESVGIDYEQFETSLLAFDYERLMAITGYSLDDVYAIQRKTQVGNTPLVELNNITALVRQLAPQGKGARIFIKDEAANPSGSFKDRRASVSVYHAKVNDYPGVVVATSGNYGAAVASQAAKYSLRCIIVQETFDSQGLGQPEIVEKGRACEAYGAEVLQLTVGPELFSIFLQVIEETGYFNASLYTPFSIAGIETLGHELVMQLRDREGRDPDMVIVTHAGGGNITGTTRGVREAGCQAMMVAASVDLRGLHMASDKDFNRKAFTTGHTGFGIPFATKPDRSDVPRNAARPLRYMDRYVTVTQGEVFYITEALAQLEGMERGPAGNTSLAAAFVLAQEMERDQIIVVQETEYTGAGKHPTAQLTLMQQMGIKIQRGDPQENIPGKKIVLPQHPSQIRVQEIDLNLLRRSYIKNAVASVEDSQMLTDECLDFLAVETRSDRTFIEETIAMLKRG
jgi:cysteine synthase